jgi:hypothetical protein
MFLLEGKLPHHITPYVIIVQTGKTNSSDSDSSANVKLHYMLHII